MWRQTCHNSRHFERRTIQPHVPFISIFIIFNPVGNVWFSWHIFALFALGKSVLRAMRTKHIFISPTSTWNCIKRNRLFVKPTVYSHNPSLLSILCPYNAKIHQNTSWPRMLRLLQKRRICAQCSCHIVPFHLLEEPVESNTSLHQYLLLYLIKDSQSFPERPAWSCAILTLCFPTASNYISWLCPAPGPTELLFQQLRTDRKDPGAPNRELQELHLTCPMSCIQNWRARVSTPCQISQVSAIAMQ